MGQHFVPQFYLRQFRIADTRKIAIAKVEPFAWLPAGSIKGQCQEASIYGSGNSQLDRLYQEIERGIAPALARVAEQKDWSHEDLLAMRALAVTLHTRTRKSFESKKVFPKYVADLVIKDAIDKGELPPPRGGWRPGLIDFNGVPPGLLEATIVCLLESSTLRMKLIRAPAGHSFITSDHPAVALNPFVTNAKIARSGAGFAMAGFQLFLPIAPDLSLMLFDPGVYKVSDRAAKVVFATEEDVDALNALQIQSAHRCVYSNDTGLGTYVERLAAKASVLRKRARDQVKEYSTNDQNSKLVWFGAPHPTLPRPLSFVTYLRNIRGVPGTRRDAVMSAIIQRVMEDVRENPHAGGLDERFERLLSGQPLGAE